MPQSFSRVVLHTTFGVKYRASRIDPIIEPELHRVMRALLRQRNSRVIRLNGTMDHVHLLHTLPRTVSVAQLVEHVKKHSSAWIKTKGPVYADFQWQVGYGVHSANYRKLDGLIRYIDNQKTHHYGQEYTVSFRQEFLHLLRAYGHTFDPAYQLPEWGD